MSRFNYGKSMTFINRESKKDTSSTGKKMTLMSKAVIPKWENKLEALNKMTNKDSKLTFDQFRGLARSLFPNGQESLRQKYKSQFFSQLLKIEKSKESHYPRAFVGLRPDECVYDNANALEGFLKTNSNLKAGTTKRLKISIDEDRRCRKVKEMANSFSLSNSL